ncbi:MAG: MFS transporter, partial [Phycisphaerae bacterium]
MANSNSKTPSHAARDDGGYRHPPGFRMRRGRNWFFLGLTYASYYLYRYNLGIISVQFKEAFGFSNTEYGAIQSARNFAYAIGQFVNGLFTDRLGGKQAMTLGAIGTIVLNLAFGFTAWSNISWLFFALLLIRMADGYAQAFGAPGMVKINTAWFRRQERGTFAGIFGGMINLGQMAVNWLGKLLAVGFSIPLIFYTITVPTLDWRYMFIVPPVITFIVILVMNATVTNHPEEAGFSIVHDDETAGDDPHEQIRLADVFRRITANPVVWIVAGAYFCTGFVRTAIIDWWLIYMDEEWRLGLLDSLVSYTAVFGLPFLATLGSFGAGIISDKYVGGRRAPVATVLYFAQVVFILLALMLATGSIPGTAGLATMFILGIHTGCNATHSILGTAAAMDLGGRKMAGFAAGVIDSFQYYGAMLAGFGLGALIDRMGANTAGGSTFHATTWFAAMLPFGVLGTALMGYLWYRHRGTN